MNLNFVRKAYLLGRLLGWCEMCRYDPILGISYDKVSFCKSFICFLRIIPILMKLLRKIIGR